VYYANAQLLPGKATFLPRLLLYIVVPAALWNLIASIIDIRKEIPKSMGKQEEFGSAKPFTFWTDPKFIILIFTVAYLLIMPILGFFVTSSIYLIAGIRFFGIKRIKAMLFYIAVINLFVYLTFVRWVGINLPTGILY
jgi:hypothetical protein